MVQFLSYLIALLATCIYLGLCGGRTGRWSGAVLLTMSLISAALAMTASSYAQLQPRMLACDLVSLAFKVAIAMYSKRRWPVWVAAFQLNTVLAGIAIMLSPTFRNEFYFAMSTIWAAPTLIVMIVGTTLDRRFDRQAGKGGGRPEEYGRASSQSDGVRTASPRNHI